MEMLNQCRRALERRKKKCGFEEEEEEGERDSRSSNSNSNINNQVI